MSVEEQVAAVEEFQVTYWFEENFFNFDWPSLPPAGLRMYARSPLIDTERLRQVRSIHELDALPGWVPVTAGQSQQVFNDLPDTAAKTQKPFHGGSLMRYAKSVIDNRQVISLVERHGFPATIEEYAGWLFTTGRSGIVEQETLSMAVMYMEGVYFGVLDPIVIITNQGIRASSGAMLRGGALFGMASYTDDIPPSVLNNIYTVTNRNVILSYQINNGYSTVRTQTQHNLIANDLILEEVYSGGIYQDNYARVSNVIDLYTYQAVSRGIDFTNYIANVGDPDEMYVSRAINTFTPGTTLLKLPSLPYESTNIEHVWLRPQRMNMVANPSFEDSEFGWQVGRTGSLLIDTELVIDDTDPPLGDILDGGTPDETTDDITDGGTPDETTDDVVTDEFTDTLDGGDSEDDGEGFVDGGDAEDPGMGTIDGGFAEGSSGIIIGDFIDGGDSSLFIVDGNDIPGVHITFRRVLGGVTPDDPLRAHCGEVSGNGIGRLILESNLFPVQAPRVSISGFVNGAGSLRVGLIAWRGDYHDPIYIHGDDIPVSSVNVGPHGDFDQFTALIPTLPDGVEYNLRLEWTPAVVTGLARFWIDNVLVDPNDSQYEYFDGSSVISFIEDYRWHGGYTNQQFSMWYNNFHNIKARLMGGTDDDGDTFTTGLLDEWTPSGAGAIPHWEAITGSPLPGWVGDYFYPITDAKPVLTAPYQEYNLDLRPYYPNAVLGENGELIRDVLGNPILVDMEFRPDVALTFEDGLGLTTEDGHSLLIDTAP